MAVELKGRYPELELEAYEVDSDHFVISCHGWTGDFSDIQREFDKTIRLLGWWVELKQDAPKRYLRKIDDVTSLNPDVLFRGIYQSTQDLEFALRNRFPEADIWRIESTPLPNFSLRITVDSHTTPELLQKLKSTLSTLVPNVDIKAVYGIGDKPPLSEALQQFVNHERVMRVCTNPHLDFTVDEAAFWYANVQNIYEGALTRNDIPQFKADTDCACFDCTFGNIVNLRHVLTMFRTVYLIPPIMEFYPKFLDDQGITETDLLDLTNAGRLVFVLNNDESRYSKTLLREAYRSDPTNVIGRRGMNTIVGSYLCETKKHFQIANPNISDTIRDLRSLIDQDPLAESLSRFLAWPVGAPESNFAQIEMFGPISYGLLGLGRVIDPKWDMRSTNDTPILLLDAGSRSIMAAALDASLFPSTMLDSDNLAPTFDSANLISDLLQIYWHDKQSIHQIIEGRQQAHQHRSAVQLFDFSGNVPILKVAEFSEVNRTWKSFKYLLEGLTQLDANERDRRINAFRDVTDGLPGKTPCFGINEAATIALAIPSFLSNAPFWLGATCTALGLAVGFIDKIPQVHASKRLREIIHALHQRGVNVTKQEAKGVQTYEKISRILFLTS